MSNQRYLADLPSDGSLGLTYNQGGTGAVNTTVQSKLQETVSVKDFGAVGDGVTDDTAAIQAALDTGRVVYFPEGDYLFSQLTGTTGGIVGDGLRTKLLTNDTSSGDVISFVRTGSAGDTINSSAWVFRDFYLGASTGLESQKTSGNGIKLSASTYENFFTDISNIEIRYLPNQLYLTNVTFYRITNCYFFFYAGNAIYSDEPLATDNGECGISGCSFFNGLGHNTSSTAIYTYQGGMKVIGNKVNGGGYAYTQAALASGSTSILLVSANTFEHQANACIRFTLPSGTGSFGSVAITGNQFNVEDTGILVESATAGTFETMTITGNIFSVLASGCTGIDLLSGRNIHIEGNTFKGLVGITITASINIASAVTNSVVGFNTYSAELVETERVINASTSTQVDYLTNGIMRLDFLDGTNLRFTGSGTIGAVESMNDARSAYQPLALNCSVVVPNAPIRKKAYTVATLPAGAWGDSAFVTDANTTMAAGIGTTVVGGGSNKVPVYYDGSWKIG